MPKHIKQHSKRGDARFGTDTSQAVEWFWMEMAGCCRVTPGGGGGGGRPVVIARPTMFMSFLAAGSSISTGLVWTESSEGTKPRLSIKLTRREMKNGNQFSHSNKYRLQLDYFSLSWHSGVHIFSIYWSTRVSPGRHGSTEHRTAVFDHTVVAVRISNVFISTFPWPGTFNL